MNLEKKSIDSKTDAKYYIPKSQLNLNEDLYNDIIFQGNTQHEELAAKEQMLIPAKVESDESLNVGLLRLPDVQRQRSWSERITSPFQNDTNGGVTLVNRRPCKSQIDIPVVDYLWQFIQKTALPLMREYEQLRERYSREKKEWMEHIEFLERQISVGRSMWRDANMAYRDAVQELLRVEKILSQTIGMKGNLKRFVPVPSESRRTYDSNLEAQVIPEPKNTVETEEFVNVKPDVHRDVEYLELKRKVIDYENLVIPELFPKINESVSGESKNTIVSDGPNNLKVGNTVFVKENRDKLAVPAIVESSSDENSTLEEHDVDQTKVVLSVKGSTDLISGGRKTAKDEAIDYDHSINERSVDSLGKQDLHKLKEKTSPKTVFIDPHVLTLSDSWYLKNQDETISSRSRRVIKEDKEKSLINSPGQYQSDGEKFNKNIQRISIRSKWL